MLWIATADNLAACQKTVNLLEVILTEINFDRILADSLGSRCTRDRNECGIAVAAALASHPGQTNLAGGAALPLGNGFQLVDQLDVLLKVLWLESWVVSAHVILWDIRDALDLSGQETTSEWAVCNDWDIELCASFGNAVLEDRRLPQPG